MRNPVEWKIELSLMQFAPNVFFCLFLTDWRQFTSCATLSRRDVSRRKFCIRIDCARINRLRCNQRVAEAYRRMRKAVKAALMSATIV